MSDDEIEIQEPNKKMVLVGGKSTAGKTASLRKMRNPEGVVYLNCESGKDLPFRFKDKDKKFLKMTVTDPYEIYNALDQVEDMPEVHTVVIDTLTYLMAMFESMYVIPAKDGQKAWGKYADFFKKLHLLYFAKSTKNIVVLAHTADLFNKEDKAMETLVRVKGSVMNEGVESYYSTVVVAKKVSTKELEGQDNDLLNITSKEEILKFKHVFQTQLTADTVNERIRANMDMWEDEEVFIDNDIQLVLDRLHEFHA